MNSHPSSLDGRYFGVLPISSVIGRAVSLWTAAAISDASFRTEHWRIPGITLETRKF
jgi:hypothetical protein